MQRTREQFERIQTIFAAVCDEPREQRMSMLDSWCGDDDELRTEVETLLTFHDTPRIDFDNPGTDVDELLYDAAEAYSVRHTTSSPTHIGPYRIVRLLGEGGMGVVYLAEQEHPKRTVALKIIRPGFTTPALLRRFEHEANILGRLQHPGIAPIYAANTADTGFGQQPYIAMAHIDGKPLLAYADAQNLSTEDRLNLFLLVCDAVEHAHQKGVLHRDLKPANILVDQSGQPKVLDFGVARATDPELQVTTIAGSGGQMIGTVPYMSPEQVGGRADDVDTRSDVYSLGVVLYKLLWGELPYDLRGKSMLEMVQTIRENEPVPPSTVDRSARRELEVIALKALEKDPERRYQSVSDLGADIRRYLAGEPISAHATSMVYQMRVLARRNKAAFSAVAAVFVILVAATTFSTLQYVGANAARVQAEQQRNRAEQVVEFVSDALVSSDPTQGGAQDFRVSDAMNQALLLLDAGILTDQPETEATLLITIANVLRGNGRPAEALELAKRALAINEQLYTGDHAEVARAYDAVAIFLNELGRSDEALPIAERALEMFQRVHNGDHPNVAKALNIVAQSLENLGRRNASLRADALHMYEQALEMRQRLHDGDHPDLARALNNVAHCMRFMRQCDEAIPMFQAAVEMMQRLFPDDHPHTALGLLNIAGCLEVEGRRDEALPIYEDGVAVMKRLFEGDHPTVATAMLSLAGCMCFQARPAAVPIYEEALEMRLRLFDEEHPEVMSTLHNFGVCLERLGRWEESLQVRERALELYQRRYEGDHFEVAIRLSHVARCLNALGRAAEALGFYEAALAMNRRLSRDGGVFYSQVGLAETLVMLDRYTEAEPLLLDAAEQCEELVRSKECRERTTRAFIELYETWHAAEPTMGYDAEAERWRSGITE